MMKWLNDYRKATMSQPLTNVANAYYDQCSWVMMQMYFMPYRIPSIIGDTNAFSKTLQNICKPT